MEAARNEHDYHQIRWTSGKTRDRFRILKIDVCVRLPLRTVHEMHMLCHSMPCHATLYVYILFNMPHNSLPPRMITTVSPFSLPYFRLFSFAIVVDYFAAIISPQHFFLTFFLVASHGTYVVYQQWLNAVTFLAFTEYCYLQTLNFQTW